MNAEHIRNKLIGQTVENVLASNNGLQLVHSITYKGFVNEFFPVNTFKVVLVDFPEQFMVFATLDEALVAWDKINA